MPTPAPKPEAQQSDLEALLARQKQLKQQQTQTQPSPSTQQKRLVEEDFDAENNTFAKILFNEDLDADEKKAQLVIALTYDKTKDRAWNRARQKEFQAFDAYLQKNRLEMHREIIKLTDAETSAELKEVYEIMFGGIRKYEDLMKPMNDTLSAIYTLRTDKDGGAELQYGVNNEIMDEKKLAEERLAEVAAREAELKGLKGTIDATQAEIDSLSREKRFKLFGRPSNSTLDIIARKTADLEKAKSDLDQKQIDLMTLNETPLFESKYPQYAEQIELVRRMLAVPRDQHVKNSEDLKASALKFVDDTYQHGQKALISLSALEERLEDLDQANHGETDIYGFLADASTEAAKANQALRDESVKVPEGENTSNRIKRETEVRDIEDYINIANKTAVGTLKAIGELGQEQVNIMTMKATNAEEKDSVRELTTTGVATVAAGIATTLTAFNQAVVHETAETMKGAAELMNKKTRLTNQSEAIQQANNIGMQAEELQKAMLQQQETIKLLDYVADASQAGMKRVKETAAQMKALADATRESAARVKAVGSELDMQDTKGKLSTAFDKNAAPDSAPDSANDNKTPAPKKTPETKPSLGDKIKKFNP